MINDLAVSSPLKCLHWKYVDDVTLSEVIPYGCESTLQSDLDEIATWTMSNDMKLNAKKCKELVICFSRTDPCIEPLYTDLTHIDRVDTHKVVGITLNCDLKWNQNTLFMTKKASKRLYIIRVLSRAGLPPCDILPIFIALIRSILEYCCQVWHHGLPVYLSNSIETIQKRALKIIYPGLSYDEALQLTKLPSLYARRATLCDRTMKRISIPGSKLFHLIPQTRAQAHRYNLRNNSSLSLYKCRTERFRRSFFPAMAHNSHLSQKS